MGAAAGNRSWLWCVSRTWHSDSQKGGRGWALILTFPLHSPETIHVPPDLISHLEAHMAAQEKFSANYQLEGEEQLASSFSTFAAFSRELLTAVRSLIGSSVSCTYIGVGPMACKGMLAGIPRKSSRLWATAWRSELIPFPRQRQEAMACVCRANGAACTAWAICADF